jgi:hypothetical protein
MDTDASGTESNAAEEADPEKSGRQTIKMLTSATNLIQLQKQLKAVAKQIFEFRTIRNRTRVITKDMVDFQSVKVHFETNNLSYYSFYPKAKKPINAVIRHQPQNTPAEDYTMGWCNSVLTLLAPNRCQPFVCPLKELPLLPAFVPGNLVGDGNVTRQPQIL